VREWWNTIGMSYKTPREHLFEKLNFNKSVSKGADEKQTEWRFGRGGVIWTRQNPAKLAQSATGAERVVSLVHHAADLSEINWLETNYLLLRRGPYVIASGLDESVEGATKVLRGRFINLFDSQLRVQTEIRLEPGSRFLLRDLDATSIAQPEVLQSACKSLVVKRDDNSVSLAAEGVGETPGVVLMQCAKSPQAITLDGEALKDFDYSARDKLLWIRFANSAQPRTLSLSF
jgi:hypothetical protein